MSIYLNLKKLITYLLVLVVSACDNFGLPPDQSQDSPNKLGCPEKPTALFKVEKISLQEKIITKSNKVSVTENVGYEFEAEKGKKLNYKTDDDICIWIFAPDSFPLLSTEIPKSGNYIIQVAARQGSTTFDLDLSFDAPKSPPPPDPPKEETLPPISRASITQSQAVTLVNNWYKAKPRIFGTSFDKSLVEKYATGELYKNTLKIDGSMNWLRNNGCYYTYGISQIENVVSFSNTVTRPTLTVKVYEELQLHGPRSAGCGNPPKSYRKNVTYWFEKDSGDWKIYDYQVHN